MKRDAKKSVAGKAAAKPAVKKSTVKKEIPKAAKPSDKSVVKFDSKVAKAVAQAAAPAKAGSKDPKIVITDATTGAVVKGAEKPAEKQPSGTITISRPEFEKDLAVAADFTERKATLAVLTHALVSSDGSGHVTISATNLEQWWSKIIAGKGPKIGRCIPAALLLKEVRALPQDVREVQLEFKETGVVSVNGRCTIYTMPAAEFPETPQPKGMKEVHVDNLTTGLQRVAHAMGENDSRYVLNGAYIDVDKKLVVATDGHRLAYESVHIRSAEKIDSIILPRKAVLLMAKYPVPPTPKLVRDSKVTLAADNPDRKHVFDLDVFGHKVKVSYDPTMLKDKLGHAMIEWRGPITGGRYLNEFTPGDKVRAGVKQEGTLRGWLQAEAERKYMELHKTVALSVNHAAPRYLSYPMAGGVMLTRAVDGNFPNYQSIIPKESPIRLTFSTDAFLQNIEGALPLTPTETKSVLLRVNGKLEIQTREPDKGEYKWQIPCESTGKKGELLLRFNIKYLVDAIKAFRGSETTLEIKDQLGPCRVNTKAVVMPMRA